MNVLKEILEVGSITDYSEPLKERQLRNRAVIFSAVMLFVWGIGMYKAHVRHFAQPLQIFDLLLGVMLMLTAAYSALVKARAHHEAATRKQLWKAWRIQQGAAGVVFIGVFVIFMGWAIAHW